MINWNTTKEETQLIRKIVERVHELNPNTFDHMSISMDITACHCNGNPLDLEKLLKADDFNFNHDIFGIFRHIDRQTGNLMDCFLPRCSK